jgi:hypothetical protein
MLWVVNLAISEAKWLSGSGWGGEVPSFGFWNHQIWSPITFSCEVMSKGPGTDVLDRWSTQIADYCSCWYRATPQMVICHALKEWYMNIFWQIFFELKFISGNFFFNFLDIGTSYNLSFPFTPNFHNLARNKSCTSS